jgi:osmotically-inducible protein OsmY
MTRFLPLAALVLLAACAASASDEKLEQAVRDSIHKHPALVVDNLRVHSENGVVYVSGLVSTYVEQVEVDQMLKTTPGVTKFVNMTTVDNSRF